MFLSLLTRKQKLKFLDIAIYMADVDGQEESQAEKRVLDRMFYEIGYDIVEEYTFSKSDSIDDTIKFFTQCNHVVKNIVLLNLFKITMVDDLYNTTEHLLLEKLEEQFNITPSKRAELMRLVYDERDLREKGQRVVKSND